MKEENQMGKLKVLVRTHIICRSSINKVTYFFQISDKKPI